MTPGFEAPRRNPRRGRELRGRLPLEHQWRRVRSLRIPVATVVGMLADGMSHEEILGHDPDLEEEDIRAGLRYASQAVRERELPLRRAE